MSLTRRQFLHNGSVALTAAGLGSALPGIASARVVAPSDRVRVGLIGARGMGWANLSSHLKLAGVDAVALCDVDRSVLEGRAAELEKMTGRKPALYGDYRRLLESKDVDAVIVATPDHWHTLMAIHAMQAGKDVYVEKPLANTIEECDAVVSAAKHYNRIVQVGQWQRSGPHWYDAVNFVWSGALGDIRLAKAWAYMGWVKNITPKPDTAPPPGVDYDMWLGPAPGRPFNENRFHFNFRWYWDYAGGLMTDWGVHLIDMVLFGMKATAPKAVMSAGGMFAYPGSAMETPDTQQAIYEFGDFAMLWEHALGINDGPYGRDHGVAFIGNNGTLVVDRGGWEVIPEVIDGKPMMEPVARRKAAEPGLDQHTANFAECIKSREQPVCNAEIGRLAAVNAQLGNIAYKTGRKVYWDEEKRRFKDDKQADDLAKARYRAPWELPKFSV